MEETLNTLRFANQVGKIKNKPIVNTDSHASEMAELKKKLKESERECSLLKEENLNFLSELSKLKAENESLKIQSKQPW
jgi:hypothetical protein